MDKKTALFVLTLLAWKVAVSQSVPGIWPFPEWKKSISGDTVLYQDNNEITRLRLWKEAGSFDSVFAAYSRYGKMQTLFAGKSRIPLHGEARFFYLSGTLKEINHWVEDHPESRFELYYENGRLKETGKFEREQKSGHFKSYYPEGIIREKGAYELGVKNGRWQYFHPDSLPAFEEFWEDGALMTISEFRTRIGGILPAGNLKNGQGLSVKYHMNGKRKQIYQLGNGVPDGLCRDYDTSGKPLRMMYFDKGDLSGTMLEFNADSQVISRTEYKNGLQHGSYKSFSESGKVLISGWFKNGLEDSVWQEMDEKGGLISVFQYKRGKPEGRFLEYHPNQKIKKMAWFKNGLQDSLSEEWDVKGMKISVCNFSRGEKNGPAKTWYPGGQLKDEGQYRDDAEEGRWTRWFHNGIKQSEGEYHDGQPEGHWTTWFGNGKAASEGRYTTGKETGEWVFYYPGGSLKTREIWNEGRLMSILQCLSPKGKKLDAGQIAAGMGFLKIYNLDGLKEGEGKLERGLQQGYWVYFGPGGDKKAEGMMKNGKRMGLWKFYQQPGWLSEETEFFFDAAVGKTRLLDPDGNLIEEIINEEAEQD
jgi:antitoxin component YwqK of YwqJK toxin-antitoxin module